MDKLKVGYKLQLGGQVKSRVQTSVKKVIVIIIIVIIIVIAGS